MSLTWRYQPNRFQYLYEDERFDKPFFCTYFKTSLFTLYLLAMGLLSPWKDTCERNTSYSVRPGVPPYACVCSMCGFCSMQLVDQSGSSSSSLSTSPTATGCTADGDGDDSTGSIYSNVNSLSDSTFVPIKPDDCASDSSGTANGSTANGGGGAASDGDAGSIKSVRFNRLAEVREMSANEAAEALLARLSYAASVRLRRQRSHHKTARTALLFCILWFIANYLFQLALEPDETALVTLLSSTSSLFTLVLAALFPSATGDRLTLSKAVAVLASVGGVVMVTVADVTDARMSRGIVLALLSAVCYAAYLVLVKHKSAVDQRINIPLFFGFVGLWNLLLLWPVFFVFNFTQIEVFELPNQRQLLLLLLNGLVGTVLSEALWLW